MQRPARPQNDGLWLFFALTFAFSWLLMWIPAALMGQESMSFPTVLLFVFGGFGPSIMGILLTYRYAPREERRSFWRRVIDFGRIRAGWYALIFLTFPALTVISVGLSQLFGGPAAGMTNWDLIVEQPAALIALILTGLLTGPLAEELGWRGFALDRMARRWGLLRAALLLGVIWGAWHLPLFFIVGTTQYTWGVGTVFFWLFLASVIPLSVFLAWAYESNRRSILAAILIHFMYNFTLGLFFPIPALAQLLITILFYLLVAALVVFDRKARRGTPERRKQARAE